MDSDPGQEAPVSYLLEVNYFDRGKQSFLTRLHFPIAVAKEHDIQGTYDILPN